MKIGNIKNLLKGGKEWLKLLSSLLLAFFIWIIHALSQEYSTYLEYQVDITSDFKQRATTAESVDNLIISGKATGFYIVKHRLNNSATIKIEANSELFSLIDEGKSLFSVQCQDIKNEIGLYLINEVEVEDVVSEELLFSFPLMIHKKVPVVPNLDMEFSSQYLMIGEPSLVPDSIFVYGDDKLIAEVDSVFTEAIYFRELKKSVKGVSKLISVPNVKFSDKDILYSVDVERYIEENIVVPITVVNVPKGKQLIAIPDVVNVKYRRLFSAKKLSDKDSFVCELDYFDYIESINSKLVPTVSKKPSNVLDVKVYPSFVECIVLDN